jgi:hypothetical protein
VKSFKLLFIVCSLFLASQSFANHYGMAGCGIGALVIGDKPGKIQILAGILNNLISPQTSAITSGTSNCYDVGAEAATNEYIDSNRQALEADVARGNGETLAGLLRLYGCNDQSQAGAQLQGHYSRIFAPVGNGAMPAAVINSQIKSVIRTNSVNCKDII